MIEQHLLTKKLEAIGIVRLDKPPRAYLVLQTFSFSQR
jgi:hypothetical protein